MIKLKMKTRLKCPLAAPTLSPCQRCQSSLSPFQMMRSISSSPCINASANPTPRDKAQQIERQILDSGKTSSPEASLFSRLLQGAQVPTTPTISNDFKRMKEDLEATMTRQLYADRAPPHHLHIYAHKHNTVITLTRPNGDPLVSLSCGNLGFRKSHRSGFDPAYQLSSHIFGQIQEKGLLPSIRQLELIFRGFGPGRDAFTKVLLGNEGKHVRSLVSRVTDSTIIKFGGVRSRKARRLG